MIFLKRKSREDIFTVNNFRLNLLQGLKVKSLYVIQKKKKLEIKNDRFPSGNETFVMPDRIRLYVLFVIRCRCTL